MKKATVFTVFIVITAAILWAVPAGQLHNDVSADAVVVDEDRAVFTVLDEGGAELAEMTLHELHDWTDKNWDEVFAERPAFGEMREVDFTNFLMFDDNVTLSPDGTEVAFTVHDYAAASSLTFLFIFSIADDELRLVPAVNNGNTMDLLWSSDGRYIAYVLDSARAAGDGLATADVIEMERVLHLTGEDVIEKLDAAVAVQEYLPGISDVTWFTNEVLHVATSAPGSDETFIWRVGVTDAELVRLRQ